MRTSFELSGIVFVGIVSFALAGCLSGDDDGARAAQALDSVDVVDCEAALIATFTTGTESATSSSDAAAKAAEAVPGAFSPTRCATATVEADGHTVTYEFSGCSGRFGLADLDGRATVTYEAEDGANTVIVRATALGVRGATVSIDAEASFRASSGELDAEVHTAGGAIGPRGNSVSRSGHYAVSISASCLSIDGSWSTTLGDRSRFSTVLAGYERCGAGCPAEGGNLSWSGPRTSLDIGFDGTAAATWEGDRGRSGTVSLFCER